MNNLPPKLRRSVDQASTIDIDESEAYKTRIHLNIAFKDFLQLVIGGIVVALGVALFIAPHNIAPGGSSGIAIIANNFVPIPIGVLMLLINIPAFFLGYRKLGGTSFLIRSAVSTLAYNLSVDLIGRYLVPAEGLTDEMILNAVYGGIVGGVGVGLIYRIGGIAGAGGVVTRLLRQKIGWPMSTTKLITNGVVVLVAGFVFGWEAAMFSLISFFISGAVADFVLEGPDVVQTVLIITDKPDSLSHALSTELERGVTRWGVQGLHQDHPHTALYCTVTRPQVSVLKNIVAAVDDSAFVIIGQGHEAIGAGFKPHEWKPPVVEKIEKSDENEENSAEFSADSVFHQPHQSLR